MDTTQPRKIPGTDLFAAPTGGYACDRVITTADGSRLGTVTKTSAAIGRPAGWRTGTSRFSTLAEAAKALQS